MPASHRPAPYSLHVVDGDSLLGIESRFLERAVFLETFGNTGAVMDAEYGGFEDASLFAAVVDDATEEVVGCSRFIFDGGGPVKSLADIEKPPWNAPLATIFEASALGPVDQSEVLDVATVAVRPEYRTGLKAGLVSQALYQASTMLSVTTGMRFIVAILDCVVLKSIQVRLARPFTHYVGVEPAAYLDSPASIPVYCDVRAWGERLEAEHPDLHELYFRGVGYERVVRPPDWHEAAELVLRRTSRRVIDLTGVAQPAGDIRA